MSGKLFAWLLTTVLLITVAVEAQQAGKIFRIGFLDPSTASGSAVLVDAFRQELSKLGWVEGKNISVDYRFLDGRRERMAEVAAELVRLKLDLIVVTGVQSALAPLRMTMNSNLVGCCTGRSAGLAPLRILST